VRLLREYETGGGDYVRERDAILPAWDAETLVKKALRKKWGARGRRSGQELRHYLPGHVGEPEVAPLVAAG